MERQGDMMMIMTMMIWYYITDDLTVDRGSFLVSIKTYLPPQYDLTAFLDQPTSAQMAFPDDDNKLKIPKPSDQWTFTTLPSLMRKKLRILSITKSSQDM
jgi:hypothetical protein